MTNANELHDQAMEVLDRAFFARRKGARRLYLRLTRQALELESKAADDVFADLALEPTRSVLHRSAASLALECSELARAETLAHRGLAGTPPPEIASELRDLLEQVSFRRHLETRGITLETDEFQMSIAGPEVGLGIARSDIFLERVTGIEKLLYRTAERKLGRQYRDRGQVPGWLRKDLELYIAAPRPGSLAVSFKVGRSDQLPLPGFDRAASLVDELLDCLKLFNDREEAALRGRISDPVYYRNFVGLARSIAPDGKTVSLVGFSLMRAGKPREIALTTSRDSLPMEMNESSSTRAGGNVEVISGTLGFADKLRSAKNLIKVKPQNGKAATIDVPEGMMDDIVRPMWGTIVNVTVRRSRNRLALVAIERANDG